MTMRETKSTISISWKIFMWGCDVRTLRRSQSCLVRLNKVFSQLCFHNQFLSGGVETVPPRQLSEMGPRTDMYRLRVWQEQASKDRRYREADIETNLKCTDTSRSSWRGQRQSQDRHLLRLHVSGAADGTEKPAEVGRGRHWAGGRAEGLPDGPEDFPGWARAPAQWIQGEWSLGSGQAVTGPGAEQDEQQPSDSNGGRDYCWFGFQLVKLILRPKCCGVSSAGKTLMALRGKSLAGWKRSSPVRMSSCQKWTSLRPSKVQMSLRTQSASTSNTFKASQRCWCKINQTCFRSIGFLDIFWNSSNLILSST